MEMDSRPEALAVLKETFRRQNLLRPARVRRYDAGDVLEYDVLGVAPAERARARLRIERFVGGGFAGQVYRARIENLTPPDAVPGLRAGEFYAVKILIPPSGFARWFRNLIYGLGFQGPFSAQVNPDAARVGALWQKFIRRAAASRLGSRAAVVNVYATFTDPDIGSCGEISEWLDGRLWRFESDDNLDARKAWRPGQPDDNLGSPEYRAKKAFMRRLVSLMREMGAHELARQYEWGTWKSQPNVLKRRRDDLDPAAGNTAVDFRAGLALLPWLPMSPADFRLIARGFRRGSLVQFDRGDLNRLRAYLRDHPDDFAGMEPALEELGRRDRAYRRSLPDIAHHHVRLFYDGKLWSEIIASAVRAWRIRGQIDGETAERLSRRPARAVPFYLLSLLPLAGRRLRRLFGHRALRRHAGRLLSSPDYFRRSLRGRIAESLQAWTRGGRVSETRALRILRRPLLYFANLPLALLPAGLHRFLTDRRRFLSSLDNIFARPARLYFKAPARERWLRDMVSRGRDNGMLSEEEAGRINSRIKEPFIQKYLKSLAVHICTLPVTQIVSVLVAVVYVRSHPELTWQEASVRAGLILGLFQVTPISPGSLIRGLYVAGLVLREKNFRDYNIAFALSFFKYIGYLAFPIQMAYRYPNLARFMAGHWATEAVHIIPVFGERGALLEHGMFDLFYNFPLTVRRRLRLRRERRKGVRPRLLHLPLLAAAGGALLAAGDFLYFRATGSEPGLNRMWWLAALTAFAAGALAAAWSGGASLARRIGSAALAGAALGLMDAALDTWLYPILAGLPAGGDPGSALAAAALKSLWSVFIFTLLALAGALAAETRPVREKTPSP
jgi:hypothetical protein